jgi:hypothetical protein
MAGRERVLAAYTVCVLAVLTASERVRAQLPLVPHLGYGCARNQGCLPRHHYGHDLLRFRDRGLAVADPVVLCIWHEENIVGQEFICSHGKPYSIGTVEPLVPDNRKLELVRNVRRKPFHFTSASLAANNVRLEQVGISVYDTGQISASGRLSHDGGPDGSLAGANLTLYLRAYAAPVVPVTAGALPINAPLVWESRHKLWISRNRPQVVSLIPPDAGYSPLLRRHFEQITHLEVELEAQRDR